MAGGDGDSQVPAGGSVTIWLKEMRTGDGQAVSRLWARYKNELLPQARQRLKGVRSQAVDEEDIVLSVFVRFCKAAKDGRLNAVSDRQDVRRLLLKMTADRAVDARRREGALRRGGGDVVSLEDQDGGVADVESVDVVPSPEMSVILADEYCRLMDTLGDDDDLRDIALLRLYGHTNREVAARLNISERSVERRLRLIRKVWMENRIDEF